MNSLPSISQVVPELLELSGQSKAPVSLKRIVSLWPDLQVSFEELDGEGYFVDLGVRGGQVMINRNRPSVRRRFSVGHELGHWYLKKSGVHFGEGRYFHSPVVERWCDSFAAEMLMPSEWVKRDLLAMPLHDLLEIIPSLPACYQVSRESMYIRLAEIVGINLFEIVQEGSVRRIEKKYRGQVRSLETFSGLGQMVRDLSTGTSANLVKKGGLLFGSKMLFRSRSMCRWLVVARFCKGETLKY